MCLIVFGQQWSCIAQRNKIYQGLDTQIPVSRICSLLFFVLFVEIVDKTEKCRIVEATLSTMSPDTVLPNL